MRFRNVIAVIALAALGVTARVASGADATYKIRIGFPSLAFAYMPYYIAQEKGIYKKHGIESEYIQMGTSAYLRKRSLPAPMTPDTPSTPSWPVCGCTLSGMPIDCAQS